MSTRRNPDAPIMGSGGMAFIGQIYLTPAEHTKLLELQKLFHCSKSLLIGTAFMCAVEGIPLTEEIVISRSNRSADYILKFGDVSPVRKRDSYGNKS